MNKCKLNLILLIVIICNWQSYSQLNKILVLNEGAYDYVNNIQLEPVSVGIFDLASSLYTKLNEISGARFASDILLDGENYWVAADQKVYCFDLKTNHLINSISVEGVRKLAIYNDFLIVSRGEYLKQLNSYLQIYHKGTFQLVIEVPASELPYSTESILIKNSLAYIGVNNGFDFGKEVGKIAIFDLSNLKLSSLVDLGTEGKNPENLMLYNNTLVTLNNKDFTGSSISLLDLGQLDPVTYNLSNVSSLCGTSTLVGESVYYQEFGQTDIGAFRFDTKESGFIKNIGRRFYGLAYDSETSSICAAETDFKTFGRVYLYDKELNEKLVFDAGVTPGYFAFIHSEAVKTDPTERSYFKIYPNPTMAYMDLLTTEDITEITISDMYGSLILKTKEKRIDLSELRNGSYLLKIVSSDKTVYLKCMKI